MAERRKHRTAENCAVINADGKSNGCSRNCKTFGDLLCVTSIIRIRKTVNHYDLQLINGLLRQPINSEGKNKKMNEVAVTSLRNLRNEITCGDGRTLILD